MKGSRPLQEEEIQKVSQAFNGKYEVRDRCLFIIGIKTGMRISELLSLNVSDVWEKGRPVDILNLRKQQVKGKKEARAIPLNQAAKDAIQELVEWLSYHYGITKDTPLFPSQKGDRITRIQAHRILKRAYSAAGLTGKVTTHSLRKSFGTKVYTVTKDIMVAKELLGHKSVATTQKYIGVGMDALRAAVDAI
ncbi:MAG: tyrosine-type recombinase/integrase [Nitrospirae bacterium]|nr:tyrosine-type recombinase/integrase [Nitrospirota bacterium]